MTKCIVWLAISKLPSVELFSKIKKLLFLIEFKKSKKDIALIFQTYPNKDNNNQQTSFKKCQLDFVWVDFVFFAPYLLRKGNTEFLLKSM